ncbi:carboxypeptidase S1 (serine carboxypeptidase) [Colletotrichum truncatum]|uniref:Carboxypeptidase S1 (Serine carboxypeptidase) n=1 Tax=Colletotrichum truncatum TaxID=5467 RepID=A0ACC3ZCM1_COLTU|nr:carboxypeptidase S1 (serine carboxypeptidase) [Colletotrichum truncatum]KAF6797832.1 carboxypeptidase S1 (serine carboxypeptidase) [Colletotrichum truncatum]
MRRRHDAGHLTMRFLHSFAVGSLLCASAAAQFPSTSVNLTTITSPVDGNVTVRYKIPKGACKTAYDNQQQYTGWVNVPGPFPANMFFWFVGAREPTDTMTIWLNGGPGVSSLFGMFTEVGPCEVIEKGLDQYETVAREWGWDRASNMLFIDQPNQVGFSYDIATNGSIDLFNANQSTPPQPVPNGQPPATFLNGTFSSLNTNNTANTTETAAMAIWHMLQGFLGAFPQYNPPNNSALGINLFAESYGGKYGPVFSDVWETQNEKRINGTLSANKTLEIHLTSLGIVNGCIDDQVQAAYYPAMAINNTYGFKAMNDVRASLANGSLYTTGGCLDLIRQCRTANSVYDANNTGTVREVNSLCSQAYSTCNENVVTPYAESGRSWYDIARKNPDSFPPNTYLEYVNTAGFQQAIGSVVNFTMTSEAVLTNFQATGDHMRGPLIPKLARLLERGIRVALIYGDRDYICNWLGGEAASLNLAWQAGSVYGQRFSSAGYAPIIVNDSYIGGAVRQFGNLSFSRIYQAGHSVPAYQPETAFQVFARVILGTSISTGDQVNLAVYNTSGDARATHTDKLPDSPEPTCWLRAMQTSCSNDQVKMLQQGNGVVINGVLYSASSDWPLATQAPTSTQPAASSSTTVLTGVFTATSTPKSGGAVHGSRDSFGALVTFFAVVVLLGMVEF